MSRGDQTGEQGHEPKWGEWDLDEYRQPPFPQFWPTDLNPAGDFPLMTPTDDEVLAEDFPPPNCVVEPEETATLEGLSHLIERHRLLVLFYGRPQYLIPAGHFGAETDMVAHGPAFWAQWLHDPFQSSEPPIQADDLFKWEDLLRNFFFAAAAVAFPEGADHAVAAQKASQINDSRRLIQRKGWSMHPVGQAALEQNAATIAAAAQSLEGSETLSKDVEDAVHQISQPTFLRHGTWRDMATVPWLYLMAFPIHLAPVRAAVEPVHDDASFASDETTPAGWVPAVVLRGEDQPPEVFGQTMSEPLSHVQYKVMSALIAAGPDGLDKWSLEKKVASSGRERLRTLRASHPLWAMAIQMAQGTGRGYRLASAW